MLSLVPQLHSLVGSAASRNLSQLRGLGVEPADRSVRIAVVVEPSPTPSRWLMATSLVDMLLRLDPLVGEVVLDAPGMDEEDLRTDLAARLPLTVGDAAGSVDYTIGIGAGVTTADLVVDAAEWVVAIGEPTTAADDGNPFGPPLSGAALAAGEAFKWAFGTLYPEQAALLEMTPWRGAFSFFSYDVDGASPPLHNVRIATTLIGVGAGVIRTIAALGSGVSGTLTVVDGDVLTTDNLNRVSYATLAGALAGTAKVVEPEAFLRQRCPKLAVSGYKETFDTCKARTPRRADRIYDVVVTGLDDDQIRWEVQRDLPRVLIDGATGKDMVARVERVEFGRYGCLGCSRRAASVATGVPAAWDAPPDRTRPASPRLQSWVKGLSVAGRRSHPDGCLTSMLRLSVPSENQGRPVWRYRSNRGRAGRGSAQSLLAQAGTAMKGEPSGTTPESHDFSRGRDVNLALHRSPSCRRSQAPSPLARS